MSTNELYHHGILGQKWGIRRYQNSNGTLTEAGKKRLQELRNMDDDAYLKTSGFNVTRDQQKKRRHDSKWEELKKSGIIEGSDDYDIISKKATITRFANSAEPLDHKRKYASITERDRENYGSEMLEMINIDLNKPISEYTYKSNKNLKVANEKEVSKYIIEKYGNKEIKELYDTSYQNMVTDYYMKKQGIKLSKADKKLLSYTEKGHEKVDSFLDNKMFEHVDDLIKHYTEKGYDAIYDLEDRTIANYPVILLNPVNNVYLKKETKIRDWSD